MTFFINAGSGPVDGNREDADRNMHAFLEDTDSDSFEFLDVQDNGRFAYFLHKEEQAIEIEMPGLPLEEVRYLDKPDQNIYDFPRLYVDGSSFVWKYAMSATVGQLLHWKEIG